MTYNERLLFDKRLRSKRNALGLTQEYVAEQASITVRFYQMMECGEKSISLDTLISLSRTLAASVDYLLFGSLQLSPDQFLAETLQALSPEQRKDAVTLLIIYIKACT